MELTDRAQAQADPGREWTEVNIEAAAHQLLTAERRRTTQAPLTDNLSTLDLPTAYRIQDEALRQRIERGETVVGIKLGLTSRAKQQQMEVDSPLTAWLTDAMALPAGARLPQDRLIHPRIEPEIAFVMGRQLVGPGITAATAMAAVDKVYGAIEVIDSRYADFHFTLPDVVADNASSALFAAGPVTMPPSGLNVALEGCLLEVNGEMITSGIGAAVQGHPGEALAHAANSLAARGHAIEAGWVVLTGGMTDAVTVTAGAAVTVHFTHLGSITLAC